MPPDRPPPVPMDQEQEELILKVQTAFKDVHHPLTECESIAEFGSINWLPKNPDDEKWDWSAIPPLELEMNFGCPLWDDDAKAYRFFLPAHLSYAIRYHKSKEFMKKSANKDNMAADVLVKHMHRCLKPECAGLFTSEQMEALIQVQEYFDREEVRPHIEQAEEMKGDLDLVDDTEFQEFIDQQLEALKSRRSSISLELRRAKEELVAQEQQAKGYNPKGTMKKRETAQKE